MRYNAQNGEDYTNPVLNFPSVSEHISIVYFEIIKKTPCYVLKIKIHQRSQRIHTNISFLFNLPQKMFAIFTRVGKYFQY